MKSETSNVKSCVWPFIPSVLFLPFQFSELQLLEQRVFTAALGRSKGGPDEAKGFISGGEPLAYLAKREDRQPRLIPSAPERKRSSWQDIL